MDGSSPQKDHLQFSYHGRSISVSIMNTNTLSEKFDATMDAICEIIGSHEEMREVSKKRVLVTAEPFGFGPSAAAAHFFPYLRPLVQHLAYAGSGHTLDIQRQLGYDQ